ncbi:MAG: LysM peptidoglycan-binding domain-containing protein [Bacillota bacterium]|nr:LysM peptidoglycan-binding domain-containing protein [Bacillota bacterium]
MSEEKFERAGMPKGMSETDKGYYEDLYTDLPKEVVDILMQTHPLMGKNEDDLEASAYRSRRPQRREDVEEVKEARMQQVSHEISEVSRAPQQEGDPTRYVSRRARHAGIVSEELPEAAPRAVSMQDEDYDDGIQYVSVMPARRKSKIVEEVTLQTTAAPQKRSKKAKKEREEQPFESMGRDPRDNRPRYEDVDFEARAKKEHLDSLYDDYDDYDEGSGKGKLAIILGIVGLILIIFLIFRTVSLSSKLEETQNLLTQSEEYKQKYDDVQLEKMQLEEQLEAMTNPIAPEETTEGAEGEGTEGSTASTGTTASAAGTGKEYTIKEGDTLWTIAQSQMGNGADYTKILAANGMKESDPLKVGSTIKIPVAE